MNSVVRDGDRLPRITAGAPLLCAAARERGYGHAARRFEDSATSTRESAEALRRFVESVHEADSPGTKTDEGASEEAS